MLYVQGEAVDIILDGTLEPLKGADNGKLLIRCLPTMIVGWYF